MSTSPWTCRPVRLSTTLPKPPTSGCGHNRLFACNGIAFEMTAEGRMQRLLPEHAAQVMGSAVFHTGDGEADRLLEYARSAVISPSLDRRRDGLEKLWDAFERLTGRGYEMPEP